jgi:hypothetical protein
MGHIISGYIDDSYLQGDTYNECAQNVTASSKLITELRVYYTPRKICPHPKPGPCVFGVYIKLFNHDCVTNSTQGGKNH